MASNNILGLIGICVVAVLVTCDRDDTPEISLRKQVQTLQAALQSHIHQQDTKIAHLEKRIQGLEAENHELKHQNTLHKRRQQKRVSGLGEANYSVGFSAFLSKTTALGEHQIIVFDNATTNDGNGYDTRHGHFTAPIPGLYAFSATAMCYGSEAHLHVAIIKEGQKIAYIFANGNHYDNGSEFVVVQLQAGQMVWVEHTNDVTGVKINGDAYSTFSGFLIKPY
ncbi:complement C1q tumor necrosis factor-related protein 3-like [Pecten maximus]|uniref:complement C1q tumor necrosis factor-related protein 3-like n=1 Tax=Pecten maximus TaxID=6579 RepID=UPI0014590220|nr:complement C1q tumor necrosis factor-related protein 3-like [Pecten maximus]